jgi:hypothetical protein
MGQGNQPSAARRSDILAHGEQEALVSTTENENITRLYLDLSYTVKIVTLRLVRLVHTVVYCRLYSKAQSDLVMTLSFASESMIPPDPPFDPVMTAKSERSPDPG